MIPAADEPICQNSIPGNTSYVACLRHNLRQSLIPVHMFHCAGIVCQAASEPMTHIRISSLKVLCKELGHNNMDYVDRSHCYCGLVCLHQLYQNVTLKQLPSNYVLKELCHGVFIHFSDLTKLFSH